MLELTQEYIRKQVADSDIIFHRGTRLYEHGAFACVECDNDHGRFIYDVDGTYGDYTTSILLDNNKLISKCNCPYPENGCKHAVAVLLDVHDRLKGWKQTVPAKTVAIIPQDDTATEPYLTPDEIKAQALEDRKKRARIEELHLIEGDMYKGEHIVKNPRGMEYLVTIHDPRNENGHCTCPDFETNRLGTCKHILFACQSLKRKNDFTKRIRKELFPFADIYWDSSHNLPRLFCERPDSEIQDLNALFSEYFDEDGYFSKSDLSCCLDLFNKLDRNKRVRVQEGVLKCVDEFLMMRQLDELSAHGVPPIPRLETVLYPYQKEGVKFGLYKKAVLIGDEMGLGKTIQAIALGLLKREIFGFDKILIVTMASLKEQWKREIERFTDEKALIIAGKPMQRQAAYENQPNLFKITNYEAVLRDVTILSRFKPDLIILDEAQRIKNFTTKTADAVKRIPKKHAMVLTGTPLENKLEDVYSIVQFLDPYMLSPLWQFAADHFMLSRKTKGKIMGYWNLEQLHERLKPLVIRRKKEEVLSDLPDQVVNNYFLDLTVEQADIHNGYVQILLPILNKKFLTPMDIRRIQELLVKMRMVCDSTFLIDRQTNISPKLNELKDILDELVIQSGRKAVIFSEWTTMTFLIAKHLSEAGIKFVELSGKVPVKKRQALIDEFTTNPECKVFLSTDAGGTGLNLQAADAVINFELPWNPARMNQRIGRVNRIGQKSKCINVVNLITKNSIEEKILAGIQLKTELFEGVFDGSTDMVEFSREKRTEMLNRLREMMGDEPLPIVHEAAPSEEIPEDTPHFLNPEVLREDENQVAYDEEETAGLASESVSGEHEHAETENKNQEPRPIFQSQPPEKIESVLNSGMQFISGLLEMATGKKLETAEDDNQMIHIDKSSGEVTMKFKLPLF